MYPTKSIKLGQHAKACTCMHASQASLRTHSMRTSGPAGIYGGEERGKGLPSGGTSAAAITWRMDVGVGGGEPMYMHAQAGRVSHGAPGDLHLGSVSHRENDRQLASPRRACHTARPRRGWRRATQEGGRVACWSIQLELLAGSPALLRCGGVSLPTTGWLP